MAKLTLKNSRVIHFDKFLMMQGIGYKVNINRISGENVTRSRPQSSLQNKINIEKMSGNLKMSLS